MTGVEAEQEFDFDFLFEFKHSDEGGGGSRQGGRDTSGGSGGGMLRGALLALPRSGGEKATSLRGEGEPAIPPVQVCPALGGARRLSRTGKRRAGPRRPG